MTVSFVEALEMVDIQHNQGQRQAGTKGAGGLAFKRRVEVTPVRKVGQMVLTDADRWLLGDLFRTRGLNARGLVEQLSLVDVFQGATPKDDETVWIAPGKGSPPNPPVFRAGAEHAVRSVERHAARGR